MPSGRAGPRSTVLGRSGLKPRSRRPHRQRQPTWTSALMRKIERLRADHPMWGKRKLAVLLRREGIDVSVSMVGRILTKLMARGVVTPVPKLRRKPGPRRLRIMGQRYAKRLPKGMKPIRPGELVQIDTLFVNVAPDKAVKHFTAYDPVAKWTVALVAGRETEGGPRGKSHRCRPRHHELRLSVLRIHWLCTTHVATGSARRSAGHQESGRRADQDSQTTPGRYSHRPDRHAH